jgi:hypothetical protein
VKPEYKPARRRRNAADPDPNPDAFFSILLYQSNTDEYS